MVVDVVALAGHSHGDCVLARCSSTPHTAQSLQHSTPSPPGLLDLIMSADEYTLTYAVVYFAVQKGYPQSQARCHQPDPAGTTAPHLREAANLLLAYAGVVLQAEAVALQLIGHLLHPAARLHPHLGATQKGCVRRQQQ